jgi:hypothetical protein
MPPLDGNPDSGIPAPRSALYLPPYIIAMHQERAYSRVMANLPQVVFYKPEVLRRQINAMPVEDLLILDSARTPEEFAARVPRPGPDHRVGIWQSVDVMSPIHGKD